MPRPLVARTAVSPEHRLHVVAAPEHIDDLGHVSNIVYVRWVQDVATAHSNAVGLDFAAYQRLGMVFVVRKHEIEYFVPAMAGDALTVTTWVESWRGPSTVRRTVIVRDSDGKQIAAAATHWVLVATSNGWPKRIPPVISDAFRGIAPVVTD